jgi:predicted HTH domain antitoxin
MPAVPVGSRNSYNQPRAMQITVDIPEPLSGQSTEELARRARLLLIVDEVRAEHLTRADAARALDMTLDEFLIEAGRHGLYAIDYDVDDFRRELDSIVEDAR